jgi:phage terminase large subunit
MVTSQLQEQAEKNKLRFKVTNVATRNARAKTRIVANQGGSRSSKTHSIAQVLIAKLLTESGKIFGISRKTGPALKASAEKDFLDILRSIGIYNEADHNKSEAGGGVYRYNGNEVYFISCDQSTKLKSRRWNYVWLNEADEMSYQDFLQFILRLSNPSPDGQPNQLFLDFNPPDEYHWIFERVLPRVKTDQNLKGDATLILSSYKDNPFLDKGSIEEIERLEFEDPEAWKVYGLGEVAGKVEKVYPEFKTAKEIPSGSKIVYGLDFGYNNPQALIKVGLFDAPIEKGGGLYWQEVIYKSYLNTASFITLMEQNGVSKKDKIYADPARPDLIQELKNAGYNVEPAYNSVYEGILRVRSKPLYIVSGSVNVLKEAKQYKFKVTRDGVILEEPVKFMDHAMDAGRYGSSALITTRKPITAAKVTLLKRNQTR